MRYAYVIILVFVTVLSNAQQGVIYQDHWAKPNGEVTSILKIGDTVYIGGHFTSLGAIEPKGAVFDTGTSLHTDMANPNAAVHAVTPDGQGGWYIGGEFTQVSGEARNKLARINADGTLHPWNPNANNTVYAIEVANDKVYIGGAFSMIGGQVRNAIASVDTSSGTVTNWNPDAGTSAYVFAIKADGNNTVYVGGYFSSINGISRNNLAAINTSTAVATSWNPNAGSTVLSLQLLGTTLYAAGYFVTIGNTYRQRVAAINTNTGLPTSWNPVVDNDVYSISIAGNTAYLGGYFDYVNGIPRNDIAAVDLITGTTKPWNCNVDLPVRELVAYDDKLYIAGEFSTVDGHQRNYLAAIDTITGQPTNWNPVVDNFIYTIAVANNKVYAGGEFTYTSFVTRNHIAAINCITGNVTDWNPNIDMAVSALTSINDTIYAAGLFSHVNGDYTNGIYRDHLAAFKTGSDTALAWTSTLWGGYGMQPTVNALVAKNNTVYIVGDFNGVGGLTRNRAAAIHAKTAAVLPWHPSADQLVEDIAIKGNNVYLAGWFNSINGQTKNYLAEVDAVTGVATTWNPNPSYGVNAIAVADSTIYIGGHFTSVNNQLRNYLAEVHIPSGALTQWAPNANDYVYSLCIGNTGVYAGGMFTTINGFSRSGIVNINKATGNPTAWNPNSSAAITSILTDGNSVYIGGWFNSLGGGIPRAKFAALLDATSVQVQITTNTDTVCQGNVVTYVANAIGAGNTPIYQWRRDAVAIAGAVGSSYTDTANSVSTIDVIVTSSNLGMLTDTSNSIVVIIDSTVSWTGLAGNNFWSDPGNWKCGHIPNSSDSIHLPYWASVIIDIPSATCGNLIMATGSHLSFSGSNNVLYVSGLIENNGAINLGNGLIQCSNP